MPILGPAFHLAIIKRRNGSAEFHEDEFDRWWPILRTLNDKAGMKPTSALGQSTKKRHAAHFLTSRHAQFLCEVTDTSISNPGLAQLAQK